jgi:hypothetical protein
MSAQDAEHPKTAVFLCRPGARKTPSWPRSWANLSLLYLYYHRNAWANLHLLDQPNTVLTRAVISTFAFCLETMDDYSPDPQRNPIDHEWQDQPRAMESFFILIRSAPMSADSFRHHLDYLVRDSPHGIL